MSVPSPAELVALVHMLHSSHGRTFVGLDQPVPQGVVLEQLDKGASYDSTAIADAPVLADARTFSIAFQGGTCKVSSNKQVYLAPFGLHPQRAIEIDPSKCTKDRMLGFALDVSAVSDKVSVSMPTDTKADAATVAWVEKQTGKAAQDAPYVAKGAKEVSVENLASGKQIVRITFKAGGSAALLRSGDDALHEWSGIVGFAGEVKWGDHTFLVSYSGATELAAIDEGR